MKPLTKKILAAAVVLILLAVAGLCSLFQWYQSTSSYGSLQGYWHIDASKKNSCYLLLDDDYAQIIDFDSGRTIYNDSIDVSYKSFLALKSHRYELKFKSPLPVIDELFDGRRIHFQLYPMVGTINVCDKKKNKMRLIKDNQFTLDHLSV